MHIDLYDPSSYENGVPHHQYAWLRANAPVYWHPDPQGPGFWALTRHADVVHVSRHPELYSSYERTSFMWEPDEEGLATSRLLMLNQDPPEHTAKRQLVNRGFTPRMIGKLEDHIREVCHQLLDDFEARLKTSGEADFVRDIAAPLPLYVICELLGAPVEDREKIFFWSNQMIGTNDPEFQVEGRDAAEQMYVYANELAAQRRVEPRDDIVTKLISPDDDGVVLSEHEFDMFVILLAVAGNETTRNAASGGMLAFFEHPEQWERLRADRGLLGRAADEIVRWVSPVMEFRRTAMADTEIRGRPVAAGDKVVVFYPSANRDEEVFDRPQDFDIGRDPNPHIGFGGGGPHFCLGAHLARMELRALFDTLADRVPGIALAGRPRRLRSNFINGIKGMPVRLG
jgi:cholest-4-en-3-one 26-monooxygenase